MAIPAAGSHQQALWQLRAESADLTNPQPYKSRPCSQTLRPQPVNASEVWPVTLRKECLQVCLKPKGGLLGTPDSQTGVILPRPTPPGLKSPARDSGEMTVAAKPETPDCLVLGVLRGMNRVEP